MIEQNSVLQGRYLVGRKLGQGGMGAVYLATDQRFGTTVALKQTLVAGDLLEKAFEREARLLNQLRHAALPVVIDYFTETEGQFLVMQFIPGEDLGALSAARVGAFPIPDVLRWADALLDALDYIHTQHPPVVHRDIKPQNLKLTPRGDIVLLDFGLAKGAPIDIAKAGSTGTSVFGYTPHYAPFEQVKGSGTDPRSDLYSLAATIYHLITGVVPPDAMTRAEAAMLRKPEPLARAVDVRPEIPRSVSDVLHRALALDRDERFASAADMRNALRVATGGAPVELPEGTTRAAGSASEASPVVGEGTVTAGSASQPSSQPQSQPSPLPSGDSPMTDGVSSSQSRSTTIPATGETSALTDVARVTPKRTAIWVAVATVLAVAAAVAIYRARVADAPVETAPATAASTTTPTSVILTAPAMSSFVCDVATISPNGTVDRKQLIGQSYMVDLGNSVSMEMVRIPAGAYQRGSSETEEGRFTDESPVATVTVTEFFLGRYEVTQAQWRAVAALPKVSIDLPAAPSEFAGDDLPVDNVTWDQCREFCARLSMRAHRVYRLPSESEWEYACRAGTTGPFAFGGTISTELANYDGQVAYGPGQIGKTLGKTRPVGSYNAANPFGLSDMHGNVWEWCFGEYHDTWAGAPVDGSSWLTGGDVRLRAIRGGAWNSLAPDCRSANRFGRDAYDAPRQTGFRVQMRPGPGDAWAK